jgi:hypothetical protein
MYYRSHYEGKCAGYFIEIHLEKFKKIPRHKIHLINLFIEEFHEKHDVEKIIANWWKEEKRFSGKIMKVGNTFVTI